MVWRLTSFFHWIHPLYSIFSYTAYQLETFAHVSSEDTLYLQDFPTGHHLRRFENFENLDVDPGKVIIFLELAQINNYYTAYFEDSGWKGL